METRAAWKRARSCSSAVAGRAGLRPDRLAVGCPVFRGWRQVLRQRCAGRESRTAPVRLRAALIHKRCLLLLSCILAALLYSPSKLSPFKSYQPKPQQPSTTLPHQQPPQCLSPDRKCYTPTASASSRLAQPAKEASIAAQHT